MAIPVYEIGSYWVATDGECYAVYQTIVTHSRRVASIGFPGAVGFEKAKAFADKRAAADRPTPSL
jgi:hypothetical protein